MSSSALTLRVNQREYKSSELRVAVAKWRNEERFLDRMWQIGLDYLPEGQMCHHLCASPIDCNSRRGLDCWQRFIDSFKSHTVTAPAAASWLKITPLKLYPSFHFIFLPLPGDFPKSCRSLCCFLATWVNACHPTKRIVARTGSPFSRSLLLPFDRHNWAVSSVPQTMA